MFLQLLDLHLMFDLLQFEGIKVIFGLFSATGLYFAVFYFFLIFLFDFDVCLIVVVLRLWRSD